MSDRKLDVLPRYSETKESANADLIRKKHGVRTISGKRLTDLYKEGK